ncbi:hypothetical protein [Acidisphaera sp. S103]|uniref:hypothetical protein n=1 Tax=Acidisphaera sp. S103 TaxID=1747223 RepID=UPI001C20768A|nr:hypothetical protein [Acidisphaera sp. S103]
MRAAMIRFWRKRQLFRLPVPLTSAAALGSGQNCDLDEWLPAFLRAIAREAVDGLDLLYTMERAWFEARHSIAGRRKDSHITSAVDLLAAAPVLSATTLARVLGIAVKNAIRILDELLAAGTAIEVTHRSKRRLFGLQGLTPLQQVVHPPYRPDPDRGPGHPRHDIEEDVVEAAPSPLPPLTPIERRAFDYTALEEAMAHLDAVVRTSRIALRSIVGDTHGAAVNRSPNRAETAPDC